MAHLQGYDRTGDGRIKAEDLRFVLFDLGDNPYSALCDRVIDETKRKARRRGDVKSSSSSSISSFYVAPGMVSYRRSMPKMRAKKKKNGLAIAPGYRERQKVGDLKKRQSQRK